VVAQRRSALLGTHGNAYGRAPAEFRAWQIGCTGDRVLAAGDLFVARLFSRARKRLVSMTVWGWMPWQTVAASVAGGDDACFLDHQHGAADRDDGPVWHPGWDGEGLSGAELHGVRAIELDAEQPIEDEEELVLRVMFVSVELALHDAEPDEDVADLEEGLVVPGVVDLVDQRLDVHRLQRGEQRLVVDGVLGLRHDCSCAGEWSGFDADGR
jgi:hypothetical protein